jgi:hypothetical protein
MPERNVSHARARPVGRLSIRAAGDGESARIGEFVEEALARA